MKNSACVLIISAACFAGSAAAQPVTYAVTDIGVLPGSDGSFGSAVNNLGQVAGTSFSGDLSSPQAQCAFRWSPSAGIVELSPGLSSNAVGINDSGQVSGRIQSSPPSAFRSAPNGEPVSITNIGIGIGYSAATGINASGQVTGQFGNGFDAASEGAFRTGPNGIIADPNANLGLGGDGFAINNNGQVTGIFGSPAHAFRTTPTGTLSGPGVDLGTLGGNQSIGYAINASGQVVGISNLASGANHPFLTSANGNVSDPGADIGLPPGAFGVSGPLDVNALGIVVGGAGGGTFGPAAVRYDGTGWQNLNNLIPSDSSWTLLDADGISDTGYITGYGLINGQTHAFLLTPIAVPEPSSLLMLAGAAAAGVGMWRRGRTAKAL